LILQVYNDFVEKTHFDTINVISVMSADGTSDVFIGGTMLCLMVWLEVLLYFGFMILPLLLHLEDLFLTSYLVFHLFVALLLLVLEIKKSLSVKFLMHPVLFLWVKGKSGASCRFWHWWIW
jgi:hypothetical protein